MPQSYSTKDVQSDSLWNKSFVGILEYPLTYPKCLRKASELKLLNFCYFSLFLKRNSNGEWKVIVLFSLSKWTPQTKPKAHTSAMFFFLKSGNRFALKHEQLDWLQIQGLGPWTPWNQSEQHSPHEQLGYQPLCCLIAGMSVLEICPRDNHISLYSWLIKCT